MLLCPHALGSEAITTAAAADTTAPRHVSRATAHHLVCLGASRTGLKPEIVIVSSMISVISVVIVIILVKDVAVVEVELGPRLRKRRGLVAMMEVGHRAAVDRWGWSKGNGQANATRLEVRADAMRKRRRIVSTPRRAKNW